MENTIPKFGPTSIPGPSRSTSLINLDEIFADCFYPGDLDFTNFFESESAGLGGLDVSSDLDFLLNSQDNQASFIPASCISENFIADETVDQDVIMIPPAIPSRSGDEKPGVKIEQPTTHSADVKEILAQSKYNRSNKRVKVDISEVVGTGSAELLFDTGGDETLPSIVRKRKSRNVAPEVIAYQKNERRQRNREHAKKSRVRKKVMLDTLADQLNVLRNENVNLRRIVVQRIPHLAAKILNDCTTVESGLLSSTPTTQGGGLPNTEVIAMSHSDLSHHTIGSLPKMQYAKILMEPDFRLIQALLHSQQNFVLSDPSLPDNPIVYASDGFCKLSGYSRDEILGRNCRFLQGPDTDQNAVDMIRKGVSEGRDISVCLLNYKKDGKPFWNQFFVAALRDSEGNVVNFVGIQCQVDSIPLAEIKERVKKLPLPVGI